ncbi:virulence factor TspB C-terminal domain-related protein [Salinivibrio sp. IB872]|uniref:virulence factor TspB C-terminal domain-related protein n=1 Tax=Salinivibrio sp. IB872 TaxID=1766123 RepID=UPI0009843B43|nr:virulence factor TspB C-terminal domain-related protein [Salinivibrio sp. IB872]OOF20372.1 hypothetical protein BZJ18_17035 [Salinivibrio sp. IB872]
MRRLLVNFVCCLFFITFSAVAARPCSDPRAMANIRHIKPRAEELYIGKRIWSGITEDKKDPAFWRTIKSVTCESVKKTDTVGRPLVGLKCGYYRETSQYAEYVDPFYGLEATCSLVNKKDYDAFELPINGETVQLCDAETQTCDMPEGPLPVGSDCTDTNAFPVTFERGNSPGNNICNGGCYAEIGDLQLCTGDTCNAQFSNTGQTCSVSANGDIEKYGDPIDGSAGSGDGSDSGSDTDTGDDGSSGSGDGTSSGGTTGGTSGGTSGGTTGGEDSGSGIDTAGIIGAINDQTAVLDSSIQNVADKTQAIDTAIYNEIVPKLEHLASVDSGINSVNDKLQILIDSASTAEEVRNAERMLLDNISQWNEQTLGATQDVLKELRAVSCGLDPNCLDNGDTGGGDTDGDGDGNSDGDGNGDGSGDGDGDDGDPSGECDPDTDDCGDGDGDTNGAQLSCTEQAQNFQCTGDPIQCEQLRLQFEQACISDDLKKLEEKIDNMTDYEIADVLVQEDEVDISNIVNNTKHSVAMSGGCPAPQSVSVLGASVSFSYDMICELASTLRPLLILLCSVISMFMVGRAVTS